VTIEHGTGIEQEKEDEKFMRSLVEYMVYSLYSTLASMYFYSMELNLSQSLHFPNSGLPTNKVWHLKSSYSKIHTVIRFVSISAKFAICTIVGLNGKLVEAKIRTWDT
jgi:hypothetical protein